MTYFEIEHFLRKLNVALMPNWELSSSCHLLNHICILYCREPTPTRAVVQILLHDHSRIAHLCQPRSDRILPQTRWALWILDAFSRLCMGFESYGPSRRDLCKEHIHLQVHLESQCLAFRAQPHHQRSCYGNSWHRKWRYHQLLDQSQVHCRHRLTIKSLVP